MSCDTRAPARLFLILSLCASAGSNKRSSAVVSYLYYRQSQHTTQDVELLASTAQPIIYLQYSRVQLNTVLSLNELAEQWQQLQRAMVEAIEWIHSAK